MNGTLSFYKCRFSGEDTMRWWGPLPSHLVKLSLFFTEVTLFTDIVEGGLTLLSPVMTMTRIPARLHSLMASTTSVRGGSNIPTTPTNVQLVSYLMNLLLSSRSMSSLLGGLSMVAKARQRRVSRPANNNHLVRIKIRRVST